MAEVVETLLTSKLERVGTEKTRLTILLKTRKSL